MTMREETTEDLNQHSGRLPTTICDDAAAAACLFTEQTDLPPPRTARAQCATVFRELTVNVLTINEIDVLDSVCCKL